MSTDPTQLQTDVAVFGAGPAGIAAAVTAARAGLSVHLVEVQDRIGGVMSSCPGMMLGGGYPCGRSVGGFFQEFVDRLATNRPPAAERRPCSLAEFGDEVVYDPEYAILVLYEMLARAKVNLLTNHVTDRVVMTDARIAAVDLVQPQERVRLRARVYLDCTGNGDLAAKSGVPFTTGDDQGKMMGASLTFFMENVDLELAFADHSDPYFTAWAQRAIASGRIDKSIKQIYMLRGFHPGSVFLNTVTVTGVDGTDPESVLAGTHLARTRAIDLARYLQAEVPGFQHSWINRMGPVVGIRETRHLSGLYQLNHADIASATHFADGVVACDNPLDEVFRDETAPEYSHQLALDRGQYYTIAFRCLVPRRVENLMFAGRNASFSPRAFASVRGMPQCMIMGQAIGIGAMLAIGRRITVQEISGAQVCARLTQLGVNGIDGNSLR